MIAPLQYFSLHTNIPRQIIHKMSLHSWSWRFYTFQSKTEVTQTTEYLQIFFSKQHLLADCLSLFPLLSSGNDSSLSFFNEQWPTVKFFECWSLPTCLWSWGVSSFFPVEDNREWYPSKSLIIFECYWGLQISYLYGTELHRLAWHYVRNDKGSQFLINVQGIECLSVLVLWSKQMPPSLLPANYTL